MFWPEKSRSKYLQEIQGPFGGASDCGGGASVVMPARLPPLLHHAKAASAHQQNMMQGGASVPEKQSYSVHTRVSFYYLQLHLKTLSCP